MTPAPSYLQNAEAVVKAFGYRPSFHDAPVADFRFDPAGSGAVDPTLHGWEMIREVADRGYLILIKHPLVRFRFHGIADADLDPFICGNILFGLGISGAKAPKRSEPVAASRQTWRSSRPTIRIHRHCLTKTSMVVHLCDIGGRRSCGGPLVGVQLRVSRFAPDALRQLSNSVGFLSP